MASTRTVRSIRTTGSIHFSRGSNAEDQGTYCLAVERGEGRGYALRLTEEERGVRIDTFVGEDDTNPWASTLVPLGNIRSVEYKLNQSPPESVMSEKSAPQGPASIAAVPPSGDSQRPGLTPQGAAEERAGVAEAHRQDVQEEREAILKKGKALTEAGTQADEHHERQHEEKARAAQAAEQAKANAQAEQHKASQQPGKGTKGGK